MHFESHVSYVAVLQIILWDRVLFGMPQLHGAMLTCVLLCCTEQGAAGWSVEQAMAIHFERGVSSGAVLLVILWA